MANRDGSSQRPELLLKVASFLMPLLFLLIPAVTFAAIVSGGTKTVTTQAAPPRVTTTLASGSSVARAANVQPNSTGPSSPIPVSVLQQTIDGSVVDPNSGSNPGAFTYQFPFTVPPGRNGMTPTATLTYSSNTHDNYGFGYGWSFSIPYIERYNKLGTDALYSTSTPSTSFYSSLSGELVASSTPNNYLTRNDNGSDYQYSFSGNAWTVTDKLGNIYVFGVATSTRQDDPTGTGNTFKWMLQKQTDANGNSILYTYTKDAGQIYPSTITYTSTATSTGIFAVNFSLELNATSTATSSAAGFPVHTRYHITQVTSTINAATSTTYALNYGTGDNGNRQVLVSITETGINGSSTVTLQPATFSYASSTATMATSTWAIPPTGYFSVAGTYGSASHGVNIADINGDGLADVIQAFNVVGTGPQEGVYINSDSAWSTASSTAFIPPCFFDYYEDVGSYNTYQDGGGRLADLNGDGLPDFICGSSSYINTGYGWVASSTWNLPVSVDMTDPTGNSDDAGIRFADVNGDGLTDIIQAVETSAYLGAPTVWTDKVYINTGSGWRYDPTWTLPYHLAFTTSYGADGGARIFDVNGDGLADIYPGLDSSNNATTTAYINTGHGWSIDPAWALPGDIQINSPAVIPYDVNGDGLVDMTQFTGGLTDPTNPATFYWIENEAYFNTGSGWKLSSYKSPIASYVYNGETGIHVANVSGAGLSDLVVNGLVGNIGYSYVMFAQGKQPDLLSRVVESTGKIASVIYKATTQYTTAGFLSNPHYPFYFPAVQSIGYSDGINTIGTTTYQYDNGTFYDASTTDRRFAGFIEIDTTDPVGNVTKTYYDTSTGGSIALGQVGDDQAKIGKVWRVEDYDSAAHLYKVLITHFDELLRGGLSSFVLTATTTELDYDGKTTHKDLATDYLYDTTPMTGDVVTQTNWGQVTAANDGSFTDLGTDKRVTNYTYAASSTNSLIKPDSVTVKNQSGSIVSNVLNYFDGLAFGNINKGNLTEVDSLKTATSTYIKTDRKTYNYLGLVIQDINPRSATTTYAYDSYNLYSATTTNALNQSTTFLYNYLIGKPNQVKDPNGSITQTIYDGIGRVLALLRPDPLTPTSLATTTAYAYTDTGMPRLTQEMDYLSSTNIINKYKYTDGFGRDVEDREQALGTNTYNVSDTVYNTLGLVYTQSLPYAASSTAFTGMSNPPVSSLLTTTTYDPLQRVAQVTNSVGNTYYAYSPWELTITDADSNKKDFYRDAYGNLASVVEENGGSPATTTYAYDASNNLTLLTDASGNVRNFTYDDLSRLLTSQDLHAPADTTYGTWTYSYDDANNLSQSLSPRAQTVNYTYDLLNRALTVDWTATPYVDETYTYDTGSYYPIGHLSSVTTGFIGTAYNYNINGQAFAEQHYIPGSATTTTYYYFDRQQNPTYIVYPDNAEVYYGYGTSGLLSNVQELEPGGSSFTILTSNYTYNPLDQVANIGYYGNSTGSINTYDAAHLYRLYSRAAYNASKYFQYQIFQYDPMGLESQLQDISSTDSAKTLNFTYSDLYHLLTASSTAAANGQNFKQTFTYNTLGDMLSNNGTTYLYQGYTGTNYANPDAVTSVGSTTDTYDADGNLYTNGILTNLWDYKDRLTQAVSTVGTTTATTTYTYDQGTNRITMTAGGVTTYYPNKYYSTDSSGKKDKYVYVGDQLLATVETIGTTTNFYYSYPDPLGSTDIVANNSGNPIQTLDYYPYGSLRLNEASTTFNSLQKYIGQPLDSATSLNYFGARYENPSQGQFISEDPVSLANPINQNLQDPQSFNTYSYANDNPITKKDPSGRCLEDACVGEIAAAVAYSQYLEVAAPVIGEDYLDLSADIKSGNYTAAALAGLGIVADAAPGGIDLKGVTGIAESAQLGREGEAASGIIKNSQRIPSSSGTASYRIPDQLDASAKTIGEVKNVAYQSLTNQLKDFISYAQQNESQFTLYTRETTVLSQNLQTALNEAGALLQTLSQQSK